MQNKYKITGFSRLLVFLVLFLPFAYIGASYYNGEDGIENIKRVIDGKSTEEIISDKRKKIENYREAIQNLKNEIKALEKQ